MVSCAEFVSLDERGPIEEGDLETGICPRNGHLLMGSILRKDKHGLF